MFRGNSIALVPFGMSFGDVQALGVLGFISIRPRMLQSAFRVTGFKAKARDLLAALRAPSMIMSQTGKRTQF